MAVTEKQQQVADLLNDGKTVPEAATAMGISRAGVYAHVKSLKAAGVPLPESAAKVGRKPRTTKAAAKPRTRRSPRIPAPSSELVAPPNATSNGSGSYPRGIEAILANIEGSLAQIDAELARLNAARGRLENAALELRKAAAL